MRLNKYIFTLYIFTIALFGCKTSLPEYVEVVYNDLPETIDFNIHVKPILSDKCYSCHGPDEETRSAGVRFDTENGLFEKSDNGHFPIRAGSLSKSEGIVRILSEDEDYIMPPSSANLELTAREKAILVKWVDQGAKWKKHWAFIKPEKAGLPELKNEWSTANEVDQFIYAKYEEYELQPNELAKKEQLLRRVSTDLTGLPPTLEELNSFLNDTSEDAYSKVIDQMLNSDAHAERLTLEWLDLARYSDSHGYHADGSRQMWPWRDWVINAFKKNMAYDDFVTEQLAGDLIQDATKDQILATGFNRNHPMTAEGGAIDEEFRVDYVTNRTNTFGTAFLGLTMECAKCHDHKFDPVSQRNYFELFAFFNNNRELGMTFEDGNFGPLMMMSTDEEDKKIALLNSKIDSIENIIKPMKKGFIENNDFKNAKAFKKTKPFIHHPFEKVSKRKENNYVDGIVNSEIENEVELVDGFIGLAPKFDNQYDRIDITEIKAFESCDPFSISVWVNPEKRSNEGTTMTIIGNSSGKGELYKGWDLHIDTEGYLSSRLISVLPNNYIHIKTTDSIPLNKWTHLLMTYDGSTNASGLKLYINGDKAAHNVEYDRIYKSLIPRKKGNLIVGKSPRGQSGDNGIFIGLIDQLSIYDTEVLPIQVPYLHEQSQSGKEPIIYKPNEKQYLALNATLKDLQLEKLDLINPIEEIMVMEEMEPRRKTYILERGEYNKHGEEVGRNAPEKILEFSEEYPKTRLGLSKWLFNEDNPLAARVAVNRYWQMLFGRGLVSTANDFGNQGSMPSHPELLDWLAVDFMESGWDVRALIRKIVTSNVYMQSPKASKELQEMDPDNKLLARSPSYRLQAEFIRNNALTSSGLLNKKVGGKSVKPYQPPGLWIAGNFSKDLAKYVQDHDEKQYRKSMYTFVKRTAPPPYMTIFDMPTRDICIVSREQTNTPLQALSLLNDPQFVEAAKALALRMKTEGGEQTEKQIERGFELAISRKPNEKEIKILSDLFHQELDNFKNDRKKAVAYLAVGDYKIPKKYDPSEMAALTIVANTLFNMDEIYTKR